MMLLCAYYYQWKKGLLHAKSKFWFVLLIILECIIHLQIPRIQFLETLFFLFFVFYALNKEKLSIWSVSKYIVLLWLSVAIVLPLIQGVKLVRRVLSDNANYSNFMEVVQTGAMMMINGEVVYEDADNKGERMWDLYQSLGIGVKSKYEGNGTLTMYAILHSIPRFIYPEKPNEGSQSLMEKYSGMNHDLSDSLLMMGVMENKILGPLLGVMYYLIVFSSLIIVFQILKVFIPHVMCNPVAVSSFFTWLDHIEISFDGWVSSVIGFVLWYLFFYILIHLFLFFHVHFTKNNHYARTTFAKAYKDKIYQLTEYFYH